MGLYGQYSSRDWLIDPRQLSQTQTSDVVPEGVAPEVVRLASTLSRQRQRAGIGVQKAPSPGIINRIFDIVQRPLYGSANAVNYSIQGKNPIEGAAKGVMGQDKTTYDTVLDQMGMSGGWQRSLLGLGLDIGLDPLTYVGGGVIKSTTESAALKAGTDVAVKGAQDALAVDKLAETTNEIQKAAQLSGAPVGKKAAEAQARESIIDNIYATAQEARDAKLAEGRGKVVFKVAGKNTSVGSTALYTAGQKTAETLGKIPGAEGILKAFRPKSTFVQGTNDLLREAIGHSFNDGEEAIRQLRTLFGSKVDTVNGELWGGLGEGERKTIAHAIENNDDLSMHLVDSTGKTLEDYKQTAQGILDNLWGTENVMGIRSSGQHMQDYLPHIYSGGTDAEQTAFKKSRKAANLTSSQKVDAAGNLIPKLGGNQYTIKEAIDAGLKPEEDILKILGNRTIESYRAQGHARFFDAVDKEFGMHFAQDLPDAISRKQVKGLGSKLGLERVKSAHFANGEAWFPKEIAGVLKHSADYIDDPSSGAQLLKMFDNVQNIWKLSMTAVNPGHHIRNFMGDVYLNFEDGVVNPFRYQEAANVLKNWRNAPGDITFKVGDRTIDAEEVMRLFSQHGGKAGFFRDEFSQAKVSDLVRSTLHPVQAAQEGNLGELASVVTRPVERIRQLSETREDWTRLAHFIDVLKKEGGGVKSIQDLEDVAREAGKRVRKYNIDYGDLTQFERTVMKRFVPFYTWMRKNIPVQVETMFLQPGKVNVIPKGLRALAGVTGQDQDMSLLGLSLTPKWLREMAGVRVAGEGMGRNGVYWNPSVFPFMDIGQYFEGGSEGIARQFLGSTSPLVRMPIEKATGRTLTTGGPAGEMGLGYVGQQAIPPSIPAVASLLGGRGEPTDIAKLLGISAYNVGPQQQLSELRRQQDIVQAILKKKNPPKPKSWEPGFGELGG